MPKESTRRAKRNKLLIYKCYGARGKKKKCKVLHYTLHFLYSTSPSSNPSLAARPSFPHIHQLMDVFGLHAPSTHQRTAGMRRMIS